MNKKEAIVTKGLIVNAMIFVKILTIRRIGLHRCFLLKTNFQPPAGYFACCSQFYSVWQNASNGALNSKKMFLFASSSTSLWRLVCNGFVSSRVYWAKTLILFSFRGYFNAIVVKWLLGVRRISRILFRCVIHQVILWVIKLDLAISRTELTFDVSCAIVRVQIKFAIGKIKQDGTWYQLDLWQFEV